ncbi:unnamed protein product [Euphydryas editha]|uniref:Uncharacterized protein n=1 Tax=Euphydryas editha TaxID=104508 RepID=A0AAU9UEJ9_EUPED|nr:unnamed protein product [Euphydryas editha]
MRELHCQRASELMERNKVKRDVYIFETNDFVFFSKYKLDSGMCGPYRAVKILSHERYELQLLRTSLAVGRGPVWRVAACVARGGLCGAWRPVWRVAASGHWSFRYDLRQGLDRDLVSGQGPGRLWPFRHDLRQGLDRDLTLILKPRQMMWKLGPNLHALQSWQVTTWKRYPRRLLQQTSCCGLCVCGATATYGVCYVVLVSRSLCQSYIPWALYGSDDEDEESTAPSVTQPSNVDVPGNAIEPQLSTPGTQSRGEEPAAPPTFTSSDDGSRCRFWRLIFKARRRRSPRTVCCQERPC